MNRVGAPDKLTEDVHDIIVKAVGKGLPWCHCAALAEIDETTLIAWRHRGEKEKEGKYYQLFKDIKKARAERIQSRLNLIEEAGDKGNWTAAAWELERTDPDNFSLKQKHEVTGGPGEPLEIKVTIDE